MKSIRAIRFLVLVSMLVAGALQAAPVTVTVMPGLTYYDGPEKLTGKLVFLLQHDDTVNFDTASNLETTASIYEFDLAKTNLHEVINSPCGGLYTSIGSDLICVTYSHNFRVESYPNRKSETNVIVYSESKKKVVHLGLKAVPTRVRIIDNHIFFDLGDIAYPATNIFEYDDNTGQTSCVTNLPDYKQGNGVGFDGNEIGFKGQDNLIQSEGFTLANSSGKVLHRFSRIHSLLSASGTEYWLYQISPDRHYAVVKLATNVTRKSTGDIWGGETYYLVNVSTGETRVLLKDEIAAKTTSHTWAGIQWIQ